MTCERTVKMSAWNLDLMARLRCNVIVCRCKADYEQVESIKITVYFNSVVRDAGVFFERKTQGRANERTREKRERERESESGEAGRRGTRETLEWYEAPEKKDGDQRDRKKMTRGEEESEGV